MKKVKNVKNGKQSKSVKRNSNNYCSNCGFLANTSFSHDKCPVCNTASRAFEKYDIRMDNWVMSSVYDNLQYPDIQGTDWSDPNSSLSRHVRLAVFNAVRNFKKKQ